MTAELFSQDLTELVCTRLSHDLIGNIGAVANAVELMDENDPECLTDVKPILEISAQTLSSRLKFFRLAFGLNTTTFASIADMKTIADNYIATIGSRNAPIKLDFSIRTPELYKVVLLGIMVLGDVFIRGGSLKVEEYENGIRFEANSPSPLSQGKLTAMQKVLGGKYPEDNPSQLAPLIYLINIIAKTAVKIRLKHDSQHAVLEIG